MRLKLKLFRVARKLNQQALAKLLGYKRAYYGHVERGVRNGSPDFWARMQFTFMLTNKEVEELKEID